MGLGPAAGPAGWEEVLSLIKAERRAGPPAPVDTAGAEVLADPAASESDKRFHVLIALFLSRWVQAAPRPRAEDGLTPAAARRRTR